MQFWMARRCQLTSGYIAVLFISIGRMPFLAPTLDYADLLFALLTIIRPDVYHYLHHVVVANQDPACGILYKQKWFLKWSKVYVFVVFVVFRSCPSYRFPSIVHLLKAEQLPSAASRGRSHGPPAEDQAQHQPGWRHILPQGSPEEMRTNCHILISLGNEQSRDLHMKWEQTLIYYSDLFHRWAPGDIFHMWQYLMIYSRGGSTWWSIPQVAALGDLFHRWQHLMIYSRGAAAGD